MLQNTVTRHPGRMMVPAGVIRTHQPESGFKMKVTHYVSRLHRLTGAQVPWVSIPARGARTPRQDIGKIGRCW